MVTSATILFREAAPFLSIIDEVVPGAVAHEYTFVSDDWFKQWIDSKDFSVGKMLQIVALELVDKAHLAAVASLIRTKRWADAVCVTYEANNFPAWVGSARGLLESTGDILDGLLNVAATLAMNHRSIAECLAGRQSQFYDYSHLEKMLDHFVHASWMRVKKGEQNIGKAKDNVDYVALLQSVNPQAIPLYHRMCSVAHPSSASISYLYDLGAGKQGRLKLNPANDAEAINKLSQEFPDALRDMLIMSCNPPLLTLRVLHKFGVHPQLKALTKMDWDVIPAWAKIKRELNIQS
jgi:hypothetical protein